MSEEPMAQWSKTRKQGQWAFVLKVGVLMWGQCSALFAWFFLSVKYSAADNLLTSVEQALPTLPMFLLSFAVVGAFIGRMIWAGAEKKYRNAQED